MNAPFHRAPSERAPTIIVQAYRIPGGAIVRITRRGRVHRYRIGSRRFLALRQWLGVSASGLWSGFFGRSNFVARRWDGGVA
jgi:hypothetical protein